METADRSTHYADTDAVLDAIVTAGRDGVTDDLIAAARQYEAEVVPRLLEVFGGPWLYLEAWDDDEVDDWDDDDPRWYREINAGLTLIELRAEAFLPLLAEGFRDPDRAELICEWFTLELVKYGPAIVPMLVDLLAEIDTGRRKLYSTAVMEVLSKIAIAHPETTTAATEALLSLLPELDADGALDLGQNPADVPYDYVEEWSFIVWMLSDMKTRAGYDRILALYEAFLIDPSVLGGPENYLEALGIDATEGEAAAFMARYDAVAADPPFGYVWQRDHPREMISSIASLLDQMEHPEMFLDDVRNAQRFGGLGMEAGEAFRSSGKNEVYGNVDEETHTRYILGKQRVGRNEPCPCGSGKKYKKCCGR